MSRTNKPKLSVCVVSYNQEHYIAECLDSLVMQETNFDFEIVVSDDRSTDGTFAIIEHYAARYPQRIRLALRDNNVGAYENYRIVHALAEGEYIAHMDGDDYALPGKLQQQVDFLDRHPECNIVFHRMRITNQATGVMVDDAIDLSHFHSDRFGRADFLRYVTLGLNSSKMYRAGVRDFPRPDFPVIDYFMNVEQVGHGRAAFVGDQRLGVYRAGIGIASSGNTTRIALQRSMLYFADKYPTCRLEISIAAMVMFAAALKNANWVHCSIHAVVLRKTLRPSTLYQVWRDRHIIPMLILPRAVR